jgi:hypothetical protein
MFREKERGEWLIHEIVLGIGGWQELKAMGIEPEVCHLNEGHAAFVALARALQIYGRDGQALYLLPSRLTGLEMTSPPAPPVEAGFDRFNKDLIRKPAELRSGASGFRPARIWWSTSGSAMLVNSRSTRPKPRP